MNEFIKGIKLLQNPVETDPNSSHIDEMGTHFTTILNTLYAQIAQLQGDLTTKETELTTAQQQGQQQGQQITALQAQITALETQITRLNGVAEKLMAYRNFYIQMFGAFKDIYTVSQQRPNGNATKAFVKRLFNTKNPQINPNTDTVSVATALQRVKHVYGGNKTNFSIKRSMKKTESLINKANLLINKFKTKVNKAIVLTKNSPVLNQYLKEMNSKIKKISQSKSHKTTTGGKRKVKTAKTVKSKAKSKKTIKRKSKSTKSKK